MKLGKRPQATDYHGVRQGFEPKDTLLEPLENNRGFFTIISEETLAPETQRDINHTYYCPDCKGYLNAAPGGKFVCMNNPHCSLYMDFLEVATDNLQTAKNAELDSPPGSGEDIEPVFMSFDPNKLSQGDSNGRMTITHESAGGRIKHVKWKGPPKLSLEDNS